MIGCHGTRDSQARPFRVFARARERNTESVTITTGCPLGGGTVYLPDVPWRRRPTRGGRMTAAPAS